MKSILFIVVIILVSINSSFAQVVKFGFDKLIAEKPHVKMPFAVVNEGEKTLKVLAANKINPKSISKEWVYITCTPLQIDELNKGGQIKNFHFENSFPQVLNDTTRMRTFVNEVQAGTGGLTMPFTGKNVLIGIVDDGIDFKHPDFMDASGKTRVLKFWDHKLDSSSNTNIPQPYDYGLEYDSSHINQHIQTYLSGNQMYPTLGAESYHGTNVTGIAVGNGLANGTNRGMAPDCKIVIVRTDFTLNNWTLSISDACDYIFKIADSLGLPCVINLSLGDYFGSHDGNDAATIEMEAMLDQKPGRIIVCAAGNSGGIGKYHVQGLVDSDTSFIWIKNNPSCAYGANAAFFDLWTNITDIQNVRYSFGVNLPSGSYASRASTIFRAYNASLNGVIYDTLRNSNGDRLATLEIYPGIENGVYHFQGFFSHIDSTTYNYRFSTTSTSSGKYDLWSGLAFGLNSFVETLPTAIEFPPIVNYHPVDSLQSIVSAWACSEKVITVANVVNRQSMINKNGDEVITNVPSGSLSINSSKGPSRLNVTKPDVCAPGDVSISTSPLWFLNNPANNIKIDIGGWHNGNGGTSMASPCISGIAALYLEKCNKATYADFKTDLLATTYSDGFTGTTPNNAFGYGKVSALETLLEKNYNMQMNAFHLLCGPDDKLTVTAGATLDSIVWDYDGTRTNNDTLVITTTGFLTAYTYDNKQCMERDTLTISQGQALPDPVISENGGVLSSTSAPNYQWYMNGNLLSGQNLQSLIGIINPSGQYYVAIVSPDGCTSYSNIYQQNAGTGVEELKNQFSIYPNPADESIMIHGNATITKIVIEDLNGKIVLEKTNKLQKIDVSNLKKGIYFLKIVTENDFFTTKFEKL